MRLTIVLTAFLLLATNGVFAETKDPEVPKVIIDAFNEKFPDAKDVEWEKDDLNYEADFEYGGYEYEVTYSADGTWLETKKEIDVKEIPEKVLSAFKLLYPKAKIVEVEEVETPKSKFYEIEYKRRWKKREVIFDSYGKQLQKDLE